MKLLITFGVLLLSISAISQAPFKSGNILVSRIGDGVQSIFTSGSVPVFLDEYSPSGTLIQSIPFPTALNGQNNPLSLSGFSYGTGALSQSPDGRFVTLNGFNIAPGFSGDLNINIPKTIGLVDFNGIINTSTVIAAPAPFFDASVTNNGTDLWIGTVETGNPIRYLTIGANTSIPITGNVRALRLNIGAGQLYSTNFFGDVKIIGSGLPTSGPQSAVALPGIPFPGGASYSQFYFADLNPSIAGSDVLYLVNFDARAIQKWSFDGASWQLKGTIGTDADDYVRLGGRINGNVVELCLLRKPNAELTGYEEVAILSDASGQNGSFTGTPTLVVTAPTNTAFRGVAMVPQPLSVALSTKIFLQGAYNAGLGRHKDVTTAWASTLNANAVNQPFNVAPFNYAGTESVSNSFFVSTGATTDIIDWVLLELHDATTPSTAIARQAAFVREDGKVVGLDGISDPTFTGVGANNYYIVIKQRNHLPVRSATTVFVNGATPVLYDFTTGQAQAYQDPLVTTNPAMKDLGGGVFGMFAGNANGNNNIRFTGLNNDAGVILNALGGNQGATANGYNMADLNLDGTVRYTGLNNDAGVLLTALSGNQGNLFSQHQ